jgi:hypothetical protein
MTPIRRALALALVLTPPLLTAEELLRSSVVPEGGSTAEQLRSVAAGAGWWRAYVLVGALSIVAFTAALLGFVAALQHRAPRLAAVGGALALLMAVAQALHLAFEGVLTAALAARPGEVAAADHVTAQLEGDPLGSGSILLFIGTTTVVPFLLAAALWRTNAVAWWAAVPALLWPVVALFLGNGPLFAVSTLLLLPLTVAVARQLGAGGEPAHRRSRSGTDAVSSSHSLS